MKTSTSFLTAAALSAALVSACASGLSGDAAVGDAKVTAGMAAPDGRQLARQQVTAEILGVG